MATTREPNTQQSSTLGGKPISKIITPWVAKFLKLAIPWSGFAAVIPMHSLPRVNSFQDGGQRVHFMAPISLKLL